MIVSSILLIVLGVLGATDILLYHSISHGIRQHKESALELYTHFLRGPTYFLLFLMVPNLEFRGATFLYLAGLLGLDLCISLVDFWLETESRAQFGGLPRGEYILHVLLAMLFGALCTSAFFEGYSGLNSPAEIILETGRVPLIVKGILAIMAPLVLYSGIADLRAAITLRKKP